MNYKLLKQSEYISDIEFNSSYKDANELLKMLRSAIITSKNNKVGEEEVVYNGERVVSYEL